MDGVENLLRLNYLCQRDLASLIGEKEFKPMSGKILDKNAPSKSDKKDKNVDDQQDEEDDVVASIEIADGNCLKQTVEFFKATTTMIPLVFYRDRMEIIRANHDSTLVNRAIFSNKQFMLNYYVNEKLFNDSEYKTTIRNHNGEFDEDGSPIMLSERVNDPRHVFIPELDKFYKQCKNISKKDGFIITIFRKLSSTDPKKNGAYYARVSKISSNSSAEGNKMIKSENIEDYRDYDLEFIEPRFVGKANQKIRLAELCTICNNFVRDKCEITSLMCYAEGFRIKGSGQDYGWGTYTDSKKKGKIKIGGGASKHDYFGVPLDFIRALSKLQTIAGNGGVCVIHSHPICLQLIVPIGIVGEFIITLIPPDKK